MLRERLRAVAFKLGRPALEARDHVHHAKLPRSLELLTNKGQVSFEARQVPLVGLDGWHGDAPALVADLE